ncbi:MAG: pilus assembly PilX N-terminal domain-containing protein [Candidatus Nomurabacteria bacterium]|nr:pilus assembly PilX N-terminal domain-containing protein [Candidatus Nomurabacteria bacterium]
MIKKNIRKNKGMIIVQTLVFAAIAVMIIGALASFAATSVKSARITYNREQAFQSAEAGIDYYRWHLAHASTDYTDGTYGLGYAHPLIDKNGNTIGQFSLNITAPTQGSSLVKIKSTGSSSLDSTQLRKISAQLAKPSIAEHAFAGNSAMRFGEGTEVFGSVHSNGGIRFDGLAHNLVTSGVATYTDSDSDACTTSNSYGVHTCLGTHDPTSPTPLPARPDVFAAGRAMGQPVISFSGFTDDVSKLKTTAQTSGGFYRDTAGGGSVGYHIVLKTNDTFDLYKINSWASVDHCDSSGSEDLSWSINTQTLLGNYAFPTNGVIFIQDNLVVDGQINGARLTITASLLPEPSDTTQLKNIIINNDLSYTNYDGTDSIGLVAQGGVMVGMISDNNLKIDGALMAQHKAVGRFYYNGSGCDYTKRSVISLYGMIASYARYGFAFTDETGYIIRNINYDANLLYAPPPNFPLTSDQYQILSWQEVKN